MAFSPQQIAPIDFDASTAVGVNIPLNGPAVFISNYQTKDAIKNNLINFFLTNPGERILNPLFGGGLRSFIFEQITANNLDFLKQDIQESLNLFFPNVIIESLQIVPDTDNNQVNVTLIYSIQDTGINDTIEIQFT